MDNDFMLSLHDCVRISSEKLTSLCLEVDCDVNAKDDQGETALVCADFNKPKILHMLLAAGANVHVTDRHGQSPIHLAIGKQNKRSVKLLIDAGIDLNLADSSQTSPLQFAVQSGNLKIVKLLILSGANVADQPIKVCRSVDRQMIFLLRTYGAKLEFVSQQTSAFTAKYVSNPEFPSYAPRQNYDFNEFNACGLTALHLAVRQGNLNRVEFLIKYEANVNLRTNNLYRQTPLHFAVMGFPHINCDIIECLLRNGANVAAVDSAGRTPLHLLISHGRAMNRCNVVGMLLENGADVMSKMNDGKTPLHLAVKSEYVPDIRKLIRILLEYSADVNDCDARGYNPFQIVLMYHVIEVVQYFSDYHGFEVYNSKGKTALHFAAVNRSVEVVKYIASQGFDVNATSNSGYTALHYASKKGNQSVCDFLLSKGAAVNVVTNDGFTPLSLAINTHNDIIFRTLLKHGADINHTLANGSSVLKNALLHGVAEVQKAAIRSAALLVYRDETIVEDGYKLIMTKELFSDYMEECLYELRWLHSQYVYIGVTLYDILVVTDAALANYARNQKLVNAFNAIANTNNKYHDFMPKYAYQLAVRFHWKIMHHRSIKAVAALLSVCFRIPRVLYEKVMDYMGEAEVRRIGMLLQSNYK